MALMAAALLNSCYLLTENLIGGETAVFTEEKISGAWRAPDKPGFFIIMTHKDGSVSLHFFEKPFEVDAEFFAGKTTRVGGETFLNLKRYTAIGEKAREDNAYIPAHYKLAGDRLTVTIFNTEPFDDAINAGKLKGIAAKKTSTYSSPPTRVTDTTDNFTKFVLANLEKPGVLDKPAVFERIKLDLPAGVLPAN